jgi:DNA polymerase kappa
MISTASYAARAHGVRSAMPGFIAMRLCPGLEFVAPDFELYKAEAVKVRAVFARFDPDFHPMGLDEAALDLTDYCAASSLTPTTAAEALRAAVRAETGLAVSCGVAPNRLLAKVASDTAKPDGVFVVPRDPAALAAYVAALPTRRVPGIGRVTEATLAALGVATCSQLHAARGVVTASSGNHAQAIALAAKLHGIPAWIKNHDAPGAIVDRTKEERPSLTLIPLYQKLTLFFSNSRTSRPCVPSPSPST